MPPVPADALLPEGATALEVPSESDRPATVCHFKGPEVPAAATAVRGLAHAPFPDSGVKLYFNGDPDSPAVHYARRVAYACITPPCRAGDPGPFIRLVFRTLALDLPQNFELLPPAPGCRGVPVLFRTPRDREAAARRQPFRLDGATVRLVPVRTVIDVSGGCMAHVALHGYPAEQRTGAHATDNCRRFGVVREIDPACVAAADRSAVRVVLQLEHPREIPRQLRVYYRDGSASVVPVEIVGVWACSHSYDDDGEYVPLFKQPAATSHSDVGEAPLALAGVAECNGIGT